MDRREPLSTLQARELGLKSLYNVARDTQQSTAQTRVHLALHAVARKVGGGMQCDREPGVHALPSVE